MRHKHLLLVSIVTALLLSIAAGITPVFATGYSQGCQPHYVYSGETLSGIGRQYGVSSQSLARANGLRNPNIIRAGSTLCIPSGARASTSYSQPSYGYDNPSYEHGRHPKGYGQPSNGYGQPSYGYAKPSYGYSQPSYGYAKPSYGYSQPSYGYAKPSYGYSKPSYGYSQPSYRYGKPSYGYGHPNYGYGSSMYGDDYDAYDSGSSGYSSGYSSSGRRSSPYGSQYTYYNQGGVAGPGPHTVLVQVYDFAFAPQTVSIQAGDTVTWVRTGGTHGVLADKGGFVQEAGDTWTEFSHTFDVPGVYRYYCQLHGGPGTAGMAGVVIVR